jgi:hypothetical protein
MWIALSRCGVAFMEEKMTLPLDRSLQLFESCEAAAEAAKDRAWTLTSWMLALNIAILAFAFDYFSKNSQKPGFQVIEIASALVGVALCGFLI